KVIFLQLVSALRARWGVVEKISDNFFVGIIFLMSCLVAFHYRSYGTFFLQQIGSIISIGGLPTTNIIEPLILYKKELEIN
ncbi:hypothetical protein, partial [Streptococcus pneumoniae]|uniref:hypothetical protein n=1 Tax=Streptococcus pneumoniae TaxID=1313 RepID=UPI00099B11E2